MAVETKPGISVNKKRKIEKFMQSIVYYFYYWKKENTNQKNNISSAKGST
jgi:hypothetical protein